MRGSVNVRFCEFPTVFHGLNESEFPNDFFSTQNIVIYSSKHIFAKTTIELETIGHLTQRNQYSDQ